MKPEEVLGGLRFVGEVEASRQTYYVHEGEDEFVLLSVGRAKPDTGHINVLPSEAVDYVHRLAAGEQAVVATDILARSKKPALIRNRFDALNALYVLCATNRAKKDNRYRRRQLIFNVRSYS